MSRIAFVPVIIAAMVAAILSPSVFANSFAKSSDGDSGVVMISQRHQGTKKKMVVIMDQKLVVSQHQVYQLHVLTINRTKITMAVVSLILQLQAYQQRSISVMIMMERVTPPTIMAI